MPGLGAQKEDSKLIRISSVPVAAPFLSLRDTVSHSCKPRCPYPRTILCLGTDGFIQVLITLFRQARSTERALLQANQLNITSQDLREFTAAVVVTPPQHTTANDLSRPGHLSDVKHPSLTRLRSAFRRGLFLSRSTNRGGMHRLEDKFATIALRISLYPLVLSMVNTFIAAEDLTFVAGGGVYTRGDYAAYCIYWVLYGGRGMFFALVSSRIVCVLDLEEREKQRCYRGVQKSR